MKNKARHSIEIKPLPGKHPLPDDWTNRYGVVAPLGDPSKLYQEYLNELITPHTKAWIRVTELLGAAKHDPVVSVNPDAIQFLSLVSQIAERAWGHWDLGQVFEPMVSALNSMNASEAAKQKNKVPHEWVLSEWQNRPDKGQGKAAFARQYAPLVKKQFNLIVNPETIARDWLPKIKK